MYNILISKCKVFLFAYERSKKTSVEEILFPEKFDDASMLSDTGNVYQVFACVSVFVCLCKEVIQSNLIHFPTLNNVSHYNIYMCSVIVMSCDAT